MKLVNFPVHTPEKHLALDEMLLRKAEAGELGETLRFWETRDCFIALGRAGKAQENCFLEKCRRDGIKVLRRVSGGGTVLQGPGCFNYSAVLSYRRNEAFKDIRASYRKILGDISAAFKVEGLSVEFFPVSDLALDGRKISGNAQARKKKYFLHHGTFMFDLDLEKISSYLKYPEREPEYRRGRAHGEFLTNIPVSKKRLERLLKSIFSPAENAWEPEAKDTEELDRLVSRKYLADEWNFAYQ